MITITPQGQVYLCKTPLENDYKNQLTFTNATNQLNYFTSKIVKNLGDEDFTYIKKDNVLKVGLPIDEIIDCNYLFYKNTGFTNKYYYCFITDMEYVNENCTSITFETDVYQTYMFDIVKKSCFVEREHVNDDTFGKHTVPEGLDPGEYVINSATTFDEYATDYIIVAGVSKLPNEIWQDILQGTLPTKKYNGVFSGLYYVALKTITDATWFLMIMDGQGIAENVYDVFLVPKSIVTITTNDWQTKQCSGKLVVDSWQYTITPTINYCFVPYSDTEETIKLEQTITMNNTLNGYTPKNNKMFTREFNYMYVTNNAGQDTTYAYEDFYNNVVKFNVKGAICPGCSIRLIPKNYKLLNQGGSQDDICNSYGLTGAKYPVCSWSSDSYTNWITQQGVNYTIDKIGTASALGIASVVNPSVAILGGVGVITDTLQERQKRETSPIQAKGNVNAGDVVYAMGWNQFVLFQMSSRYEYAKRIDDYLNAFGYKVNTVKIPETTSRTYWNYVKTIDCNFEGDIPQIYLNKIKEIFNKGITLWHDPTKFLDYSQNNTIVS